MKYKGTNFDSIEHETVLDTLLRHQQDIDHSCKQGNCQACMMRSINGEISNQAQRGLKKTDVARQHFLSCQQLASTIKEVAKIDDSSVFNHAILTEKTLYTPDVLCLKLKPTDPFYYHAGQFINLLNPVGDIRSYSIASLPSIEPYIELHIKKIVNGKVSSWLFDECAVGDVIDFQGPLGSCFYAQSQSEHKLVLIGTGTGAAPLIGIAKDALYKKHLGEIHFYHGVKEFESLYLHQQLSELALQHVNFFYHPCLSGPQSISTTNIQQGRANEIALKAITKPDTTKLYLCGNPDMVNSTQKRAFLSNVPSSHIFVDPFEYV